MQDSTVQDHIEQLVAEETRLLEEGAGTGPDADRHARLEEVRVELDRYWDLLRRRRAHEEFRHDPDDAKLQDAPTVEGYQQ